MVEAVLDVAHIDSQKGGGAGCRQGSEKRCRVEVASSKIRKEEEWTVTDETLIHSRWYQKRKADEEKKNRKEKRNK